MYTYSFWSNSLRFRHGTAPPVWRLLPRMNDYIRRLCSLALSDPSGPINGLT